MVIFVIYLVVAVLIPAVLYFTFGKERGLDWGFGEVVLFMLLPFLSYLVLINVLILGSPIKQR